MHVCHNAGLDETYPIEQIYYY